MKRTLLIGIRNINQLEQETINAFKNAEAGLPGEKPAYRLYFSDQSTLFRALSPKRWEMLKFMRKHGPISIKKLASELKRDYKNVYDDVKYLSNLELIQKEDNNKLNVPWDDITIQLALAA